VEEPVQQNKKTGNTKTTTAHGKRKERHATPTQEIHTRRHDQPIPLLVHAANDIFRAIVFK
jgi:hypothetical protein